MELNNKDELIELLKGLQADNETLKQRLDTLSTGNTDKEDPEEEKPEEEKPEENIDEIEKLLFDI